MNIVEIENLSPKQLEQAARILRAAFAHMPSAFKEEGEVEAEIESFLTNEDRGALVALVDEEVAGWIGWVETYSHSWELHPLAVDPAQQRRGIGTLLVAALESRARAAGILTLWLGADDDYAGTNVYGADVFPDVLRHAATIRQVSRHPIAFYRKLGFEVVGLLPDANGFGKPDILMAKRLVGDPLRSVP